MGLGDTGAASETSLGELTAANPVAEGFDEEAEERGEGHRDSQEKYSTKQSGVNTHISSN